MCVISSCRLRTSITIQMVCTSCPRMLMYISKRSPAQGETTFSR
ncbi:TPA: hypothetical protein MJB68_23830 [Klebsiella pneumoniae]|nr:hypothetical protein [Klebsiella pneumoniae]ROD92651.1 hypothetical protein C4Z03_008750 [Klebsiella pneumoniae subsp. pneumoniae]HBX5817036.1 hypothetical protein [Klebsiella pneumoniae]HBY8300674.1 hypothetical protein [Klebsiella pneumoniae]HBZ0423507.1 hypothetical protein [Klebsiella pneumoniae]